METISNALLLNHLHHLPLTPQPHINAVPIHLGNNPIDTPILRNNPRCREAVEDDFDGGVAIVEGDATQFARVHELDAFAGLAFAEFPAMRHAEGRARQLEPYDVIDVEDGQEVSSPIRQIGDEIEIILGEHDGDRIHLMCALRDVLMAVGDAYRMLCRHVPREFPDRREEFFPWRSGT